MFKKSIQHQIIIQAPVNIVWDTIVNLKDYPKWNLLTPAMSFEFVVGHEFLLDTYLSEKEVVRKEPMVMLSFNPEKYDVSWGTSRTKPKFPGIKSCRRQTCMQMKDNNTSFAHVQKFEGILTPIVLLLYKKKLNKAFYLYCESLKKYSESIVI